MAEAMGPKMAVDYRAYAIGPDDRIVLRVDLVCADDDAAKERARQISTHTIELWRDRELLARFDPMLS
jgi:hypothetical protein